MADAAHGPGRGRCRGVACGRAVGHRREFSGADGPAPAVRRGVVHGFGRNGGRDSRPSCSGPALGARQHRGRQPQQRPVATGRGTGQRGLQPAGARSGARDDREVRPEVHGDPPHPRARRRVRRGCRSHWRQAGWHHGGQSAQRQRAHGLAGQLGPAGFGARRSGHTVGSHPGAARWPQPAAGGCRPRRGRLHGPRAAGRARCRCCAAGARRGGLRPRGHAAALPRQRACDRARAARPGLAGHLAVWQ